MPSDFFEWLKEDEVHRFDLATVTRISSDKSHQWDEIDRARNDEEVRAVCDGWIVDFYFADHSSLRGLKLSSKELEEVMARHKRATEGQD